MTTDAAIRIDGITKHFRRDRPAVDRLSFGVARGEVCGLLGPNGAGKTTTLRILLGLVHAEHGSVAILGEQVHPGHRVLDRVGAIVERPAFIPHLNGRRNLRLHHEAGGGAWPPDGLDAALEVAGLGSDVDRKVKTYSQGMRQRLGIAQALMGRPEVLVLDEPTNGLDPGEMREMRSVLRSMSGAGVTTLLSTHLLSEVEQVCTSAVVMHHGRLIAEGSVADLVGAVDAVYLEVDDVPAAKRVLAETRGVSAIADDGAGIAVTLEGVARTQIVERLVRAGIGVQTVTARRRLEDAFMQILGEEPAL